MTYNETILRTELAEARTGLLAAAAAGPDAVRALVAGSAGVTAAVDLRTGEALAARVALAGGGTRVWYDTATACLNGVRGSCYGVLPLDDPAAAGLMEDAAWHPDAAAPPDARGAA